jgi:hypothetical protein
MDELEHLKDFLESYSGPTVLEVNRLYHAYEGWAADRPKLTSVMLVKRLVGLGAFKRRTRGLTILDFTGLS